MVQTEDIHDIISKDILSKKNEEAREKMRQLFLNDVEESEIVSEDFASVKRVNTDKQFFAQKKFNDTVENLEQKGPSRPIQPINISLEDL